MPETESEETTEGPPIFVPVALKLDEARALLHAALSVFDSLAKIGLATTDGGELARGMTTLAKAIDKTTGEETT